MAIGNYPLPSVVPDTMTDLVAPATTNEDGVNLAGLIICNYGSAPAIIRVVLTDSENAILGHIVKDDLDPGASIHMDTKLFIAAKATPDKIRVESDQADVSFIASVDEE